MKINIEHLEVMKGREILAAYTEVSTIAPINHQDKEDEIRIEVPLKVVFEQYLIFIYHKWSIISDKINAVEDLKGRVIVDVGTIDETIEFWLSDSEYIKVDLSDNGCLGPESLVLYGPNNLIIVWDQEL